MQRPTPRIEIVKREQKEASLIRFLGACALPASGAPGTAITIVARSADSPVIAALAKVLGAATAAEIGLRIIVAQTESSDTLAARLAPHRVDVRWARHPRLADAHEQMVLGGASWIGDCMRRDPAKRDAFECYAEDCSQSVRWATMAFERLWTLSEPMPASAAPAIRAEPPVETAVAVALPSADNGEPAPIASTRH